MSSNRAIQRFIGIVCLLVMALAAVALSAAGDGPVFALSPVIVVATNASPSHADAPPPAQGTLVLGEAQLRESGGNSVVDLQYAVPNLSVATSRTRSYLDTYSMRGMAGLEFLGTPAVGVYVDDAPLGDAGNYKSDWLVLEKVEVFRGPQGTRFGKNAEAGVINLVSRQPGDRWEAETGVRYGSFNTLDSEALVMGPLITNVLSLSLAGRFSRSDGFIHNDFLNTHADHQEGLNGRAALRWTPVESWDIRLTVTGDRHRDGLMFVPLSGDPRHTQASFDGLLHDGYDGQVLRAQGMLAGLELTSITARRGYQLDPFKFDGDFSPLNGNTGVVRRTEIQWSEELRVRPQELAGPWDWHTGFFFSTSSERIDQAVDFFIPFLSLTGSDEIDYRSASETYAIFGEISRTVLESWEVTLGLRLDDTSRRFSRSHVSTLGPHVPLSDREDFLHAAPKLTLAHPLSESTTWHASSGLGFRPGGFNPFLDPPSPIGFDSERSWASELGVRTSWWEERVAVGATAFYTAVFDYQLSEYIPSGAGVAVVNAARGRTYGFELESNARITGGWQISGFFGFTEARVNQATDPFTLTTAREVHPPFVAAFNGGAALVYRGSGGWFGRVQFSAIGDTYSDVANSASLRQGAYGLLGVRLGRDWGHFGVEVFGENLADSQYYARKVAVAGLGAPGRPLTVGVRLTARY